MKSLLSAAGVAVVCGVVASPLSASGSAAVDRVLVKKSDRKLLLLNGEQVVKSYPIALGGSPEGHKVREGDMRTPEGSYVLDWRNPRSRFYRSIHISYPNNEDRLTAENLGVEPGGDIMIHGLPNDVGRLVYVARGKDWTRGCIALDNEAMREVWDIVPDHTPIEIVP